MPQCALNSYMLSPFTLKDRYVSQYVPGDFVVHMAGHKGSNKARLFEYCHSKARVWEHEHRQQHQEKRQRHRRVQNVPSAALTHALTAGPAAKRVWR